MKGMPTLEEALASRRDVWGEAAFRQPEGPSYEFFARLLPPLRYVNAAFRHYPIVLSAPRAAVKARLVSNGSALNARANLGTWYEVGHSVAFRVGQWGEPYGEDLARLDGPRYAEGYLPIVRLAYRCDGTTLQQEAFASVAPGLAEHGAVFVRFDAGRGSVPVAAHLAAAQADGGLLRDGQGRVLAAFSSAWRWDASDGRLLARVSRDGPAVLMVLTRPVMLREPLELTPARCEQERRQCAAAWDSILRSGARIEVPEPIVNDAWRALVVGCLLLEKGDLLCYSAGNQYERLYEAECGDIARALLLFGLTNEVRRAIPPLLDYDQSSIGFHTAAFKLQMLAHFYWVTRDAAFVRELEPRWRPELERILAGREPATGLLPPEAYCGDIGTPVHSLNANANAWRGLRDMAAVLEAMGDRQTAAGWRRTAAEYRERILAATAQSERRDVHPPFLPIALFGKEAPYETLTASMLGSYWCLMAPYVVGSGVFGDESERTGWILDTLHERGGVCMGLIRFHQHSGLFANENGLDDLYGLRYVLALLRRDEVDRALVSFYGKLAQGLTRDTFIGAEGTGLQPLDRFGRPMYLPPNGSANALFLWTLRYLLVQDWDLDDDGRPETLRLLYATPRRWLRDGARLRLERLPTAFGPMSLAVDSRLARGEVAIRYQPPPHVPERVLLRLRLPDGWRAVSAREGRRPVALLPGGVLELAACQRPAEIRVSVRSRGQG